MILRTSPCAFLRIVILVSIPHSLLAQSSIRFAAVGDYGTAAAVGTVANMIAGWNPGFVITLGDNNYTANNTTTASWDNEVGQFYGQYIKYPPGSSSAYAPGPPLNKFYPSVGNHDWDADIAGWYDYFELLNNERYFDFVKGPVHFFVVDSDPREPDGNTSNSVQAQWLHAALLSSTSLWKIVYFHHPPYTSASRGNNTALQWPFKEWGATAVLTGHEHQYERIVLSGFPYIVNGAGGQTLSGFSTPIPGSVVRYSANHGAMLIDAGPDSIEFKFYSIASGGTLIDRYAIDTHPESTLIDQGAIWKYLDNNSNQGTAWRDTGFNDNSWSSGPAKLGFGDDNEVTVINGGPSGNRYITTYFRRAFVLDDPSVFTELSLEVIRDDGAVVYLNGVEAWRTNMPAGPITSSIFASSSVGEGPDENTFYGAQINPSILVAGPNVLAVEVHQSSLTSSDLGFDLRLVGSLGGEPLPIQLASFTAVTLGGNRVRLDWITLTETNNYGFEIQRGELPNYQTLPNSFIPGHGTTIEPHSYSYTDTTAMGGVLYYRLRQIDLDGTVHFSDGIRVDLPTHVAKPEIPAEFSLGQNYPNPFNPSTIIKYTIPSEEHVTLKLYSLLGEEVATLVDQKQMPGSHEAKIDAQTLAGGVYFYRLMTAQTQETRKFVVVK